MQNFESCDGLSSALEQRLQARLEQLQKGRPDAADNPERNPTRVAADFASVLYGQVVKQMQKSMESEEEESPLSGGVRDFMGMLLPKAISRSAGDPVAAYIEGILTEPQGGKDDSDG